MADRKFHVAYLINLSDLRYDSGHDRKSSRNFVVTNFLEDGALWVYLKFNYYWQTECPKGGLCELYL
jgi:hypothetical protein